MEYAYPLGNARVNQDSQEVHAMSSNAKMNVTGMEFAKAENANVIMDTEERFVRLM